MKHPCSRSDRYCNRDQKSRRERKPASGKKYPVIPAGIGQAEKQPTTWRKRPCDGSKSLPVNDFLRRERVEADAIKNAFNCQSLHAGKETPACNGGRLTNERCKTQKAPEQRGRKSQQRIRCHSSLPGASVIFNVSPCDLELSHFRNHQRKRSRGNNESAKNAGPPCL